MAKSVTQCPACHSTNLVRAKDRYGIDGVVELEDGTSNKTRNYIMVKATLCRDCDYVMFFRTAEDSGEA